MRCACVMWLRVVSVVCVVRGVGESGLRSWERMSSADRRLDWTGRTVVAGQKSAVGGSAGWEEKKVESLEVVPFLALSCPSVRFRVSSRRVWVRPVLKWL